MATNVARIQAELDLDNGRFSGKITNSIGQVQRFGAAVNNTSKSIQNIERRVTGFGASVRDAMVVLGQFRASMMTLWAGSGQWVGAIIKANAELERMQALMRGVASGNEAARAKAANADLAYTIKLAQEAPFSINAIGDSMVKLRSAGLDATKVMSGLTNAVAAFGGNDETLKRATVALQQMAGKGVVSMEELRQQLGEAVPTAMRLMARGLNVSLAELNKKVSLGTVEAQSSITAMVLEMDREYNGAARKMMNTWTGMTAKLKTEWMLFAKEVGDAGLFNAAKEGLRQLSAILSDPNTINTAKALGQALGELITTFSSGVQWIMDNQNALIAWGQALGALVVGGYVMSLVRNLTFLKVAMAAMQASMVAAGAANGNFIKSFAGMGVMGTARTLATGLGAGLNSLLMTFTGFSGPVGIAIAAIGALIGWFVKLRAEAEQVRASVQRALEMKASDFMSAEDIKGLRTQMATYDKLIARGKEAMHAWNPESRRDYLMSMYSELGNMDGVKAAQAANAQELGQMMTKLQAEMLKKKNQLQATITRSDENFRVFNENKFVQGNAERIDAKMDDLIGSFSTKEKQLEDQRQRGLINQEQYNAASNKILQDESNAKIAVYDASLASLQKSLTGQTAAQQVYTNKLIAELNKRRTAELRTTNEMMAGRKAGIQTLTVPGGDKEAAKKAKADADSLAGQLENLMGKNAQLKAQVEGDTVPTLEKFNALLAAGKWGKNPDDGVVGKIRAIIQANADLAAELKKNKATEKLGEDLDEMEAKAKADVVSASLKASGDVYSKVAAGMVGFNREVEVMRANLDKTSMSSEEFEKRVKGIRDTLFEVDMTRFRDWVVDTNMDNNNATLDERAQRIAEYNEKLRQYKILRDNLLAQAGSQSQIDEINKGVDAAIESETRRMTYETRSSWQKWLDDYKDITQEMDDVWANSMDNFTTEMTNAFVTGKMGWKDFATSVLKEITRVMTAKAVAAFVQMAVSFFSGSGGGYTGDGTGAGSTGGFGNNMSNFTASANGNIMTGKGPMRLNKYAKGGIATSPQLSLFGEGDTPEAYVPLPDGRSIPVTMEGGGGGVSQQNNVSVNVTVNRNGDAESTVEGDTSDGKAMGKAIDAAVRKIISDEMRPGGQIWKNNQQRGA